VAAQAGQKVHLVDVDQDAVQRAHERIQQSLHRVAKKKFEGDATKMSEFVEKTMSLLHCSTDSTAAVAESDLVLEAIVENLQVKQDLFAKLDKIVRIPETSAETYDSVQRWGQSIGKVTVTCKDTPGFIVNRLLVPYMGEAMRMLERGDATAKDIDTAMKLGAGYPMGPFELIDYVGLDTNYFIMEGWAEKYPANPLFAKIPLLEKLYKEGKFGMKSGEGFYKYSK
ncbi:3-hydroxyacyl-CoA dehydrogenase NAD binding, partial [Trinorchestia longiramus]